MVSQSLRKGGKASSPLSRLKKLIDVGWVWGSDVSIDVLDEVREIKNKYCKDLKSYYYSSKQGIYRSANLYKCKHPSLDKFYLMWSTEEYSDLGGRRVGFMLTRDLSRAKKVYNLFRAI